MGLFGLFGKKSEKQAGPVIPWIPLERPGQLEEIDTQSLDMPVLIFKHSTRCGISSMALRQFENNLSVLTGEVKLYYLDLLAFRDLSDKVAARFQVWHQSPQIIIRYKGETVHHASHHNIHPAVLNDYIELS